MKLKIILTRNGKRFDRLYSIVEGDIFEFYTNLLNHNLSPISKQMEVQGGYITIDLTTETLAATVSFHGVSDSLKEEIRGLLYPYE
jgi:hypothetical protein